MTRQIQAIVDTAKLNRELAVLRREIASMSKQEFEKFIPEAEKKMKAIVQNCIIHPGVN